VYDVGNIKINMMYIYMNKHDEINNFNNFNA